VSATAGNAQATVSFTAPASNGGSAITGYIVTSNPAGGMDSNAGTTALSHTISGLAIGTAYTFTVKAINSVGMSAASTASNSVTPIDTQAPTVPMGLSLTNISGSRINLTWTPSTDNVGVTQYKVYRGGSLVTTLGALTSYSDTGLAAGTTYSYTVLACDAAGNCSAQSAAATATTTPATTTTSTNATTTTTANTTTTTLAPATLDLNMGWNLLGNSSTGSLDVAGSFGDATKVSTVWKWIANSTKWAFYAPSLIGQALVDYASGKGYDVLATITGGEGFWVNAKQATSVALPTGNPVTIAAQSPTLIKGWNLSSIGETATPKQFCDAQTTGVTTLWAWDSTNSAWYFYAPSLDTSGSLSSYITSKGYLDFTTAGKSLGQGVGFWVNRP
jgi:chitodextrinase